MELVRDIFLFGDNITTSLEVIQSKTFKNIDEIKGSEIVFNFVCEINIMSDDLHKDLNSYHTLSASIDIFGYKFVIASKDFILDVDEVFGVDNEIIKGYFSINKDNFVLLNIDGSYITEDDEMHIKETEIDDVFKKMYNYYKSLELS